MSGMIEVGSTQWIYSEKFNASVFFDMFIAEDVYVDKDDKRYFFNSKKYDYERLMEQSLKEGRDLIYELCKDKPIPQHIYEALRNIKVGSGVEESERIKKTLPYYDEII